MKCDVCGGETSDPCVREEVVDLCDECDAQRRMDLRPIDVWKRRFQKLHDDYDMVLRGKQIADDVATVMHRRAQKAEGLVARLPRVQEGFRREVDRIGYHYCRSRRRHIEEAHRARELLWASGVDTTYEPNPELKEWRVDVLVRRIIEERDNLRYELAASKMWTCDNCENVNDAYYVQCRRCGASR